MKTYVDEYFESLNGPEKRSIADNYGLDFTKMGGNIMVVLSCGGEVIDAGLMSYSNFLLSLKTKTLLFNPCRVASVVGSLQVLRDCDNDTLMFDYVPSSLSGRMMPEYCHKFSDASFEFQGDLLVPAVVYDRRSSRVVMVGATCREALQITKDRGFATFYSRTREVIWTKGETSGNLVKVDKISYNNCGDGAVIYVTSRAPEMICHEGTSTCFAYNDGLTNLFG